MSLDEINRIYGQNLSQQEYELEARHVKEHFQYLQNQFGIYYDEMAEAYQISKRHGLGTHGRNQDQNNFCSAFKSYLVEVIDNIFTS